MNEFKPVVGIEFDNKYANAKNKLFEFTEALSKLTPAQKEQLAKEFIASTGMAASVEHFINHLQNGGQV